MRPLDPFDLDVNGPSDVCEDCADEGHFTARAGTREFEEACQCKAGRIWDEQQDMAQDPTPEE